MSNTVDTKYIASSIPVHEARPAAPVPAAAAMTEPKVEIKEQAKQAFARKSEVGADMERLQQTIEASIEKLNEMLKNTGRNLTIGMDRVLGAPIVTVKNDAGEVVRQIPNEVVVHMAHSIEEFKGWLHDQTA